MLLMDLQVCAFTILLGKKENIIEKFLRQLELNPVFKSLRNKSTWKKLQKLQIC